MSSESKFGALTTLVARDLSEIADLPEFKTPPPGVYKFLIEECKQVEIGDKTAIRTTYVIVDTVELNDPDEYDEKERVKPGDKFSEAFWFSDPEKIEQTISVLKAKYSGLAEPLGTTDLATILDKMEGMIVQGIITNRKDKDDKTKLYPSTKEIRAAT